MEKKFNEDVEQKLKADWESMLSFIDKNSTSGFAKKSGHLRTPRVRFETLSVGTALALAKKPDLQVGGMDWINDESDEFHKMATSGSSNSKPKIKKRLEYVRDRLLKESLK